MLTYRIFLVLIIFFIFTGLCAQSGGSGTNTTGSGTPGEGDTITNIKVGGTDDPSGGLYVTSREGHDTLRGYNDISSNEHSVLNSTFDISKISWFAIASGIASILSLMLTLYGTQIRSIPYSFYRSCVWNRTLLISLGCGIFVFSSIKFYTQTAVPEFPWFGMLFIFLHGKVLNTRDIYYFSGSNLWAIIALLGIGISALGFFYDPVKKCKAILFREQEALLKYRREQLSSVLSNISYENLKSHEKHLYDDLNKFHVELQSRLIDTIYGQGNIMRSHIARHY